MEMFLHSVVSVAIILLLTATGYFCAARGWVGQESKAFLSKFLMSIAIPAMCVDGLTHNLTHEMIASSVQAACIAGHLQNGDVVIISAGVPTQIWQTSS